ncbi:MAG: hypothetical protein P4L46_04415 [Fimbriimonas sp.]|nr:hypothetical protein [Fimbriimonas sp.]
MINILTFGVALIAAAINAMPIYRLLIALKSRQTVSKYAPEAHQQKQGTPTMGGLIVAVGFLAGSVPFLIASIRNPSAFNSVKSLAILGIYVGFAVIGFVDDYVVPRVVTGKRGLEWKQKILMQFAVAGLSAWFLTEGFGLDWFVLVFLILFFSNAYNFSDGLDALASLLLVGLGGGLILIAHMRDATNLEPILFALLGAIIPFLFLNKPKAKIFMGDVGSLPIGAVLGVAFGVLCFPNELDFMYRHTTVPGFVPGQPPAYFRPQPEWQLYAALAVIAGMMIVELVPVPLQILSVKIRKKKLFSFTPIHHAFERMGWPEVKVVVWFFAAQLAMSLVAISIVSAMPTPMVIARSAENQYKAGIRWHDEPDSVGALPTPGVNP